MNRIFGIFAAFLTAAVGFLGGMFSARAAEHVIEVQFVTESGPVEGAAFSVYEVMDVFGQLTGEFADLPIDVGDLSDVENVNALTGTLASFVADGTGTPAAQGETDSMGRVLLTVPEEGVYLLTESRGEAGGKIVASSPALVSVRDDSPNPVELSVKYSIVGSSGESKPFSVEKVWTGGDGASRPDSVTVRLLRGGEVYDEVELSEANGWSYTWEGLSVTEDWNVAEENIPAGYSVTVTRDGQVFTVENTYIETTTTTESTTTTAPEETTTTTAASETTTTTSAETTTTTTTTTATAVTQTTAPPKLPQTGQLWWPVPVLFAGGLVLFVIGLLAPRTVKDDEER